MVKLDVLGESIDRLITVDLAGRGVIYALYAKAREIAWAPLALKAAQALQSTVSAEDKIIITTGFPIPPTMAPETDGPLGALVLSRALSLALGAESVIVAEKGALDLTAALAKSVGMSASEETRREKGVKLLDFPLEEKDAMEHAVKIIEKYNPSAIIAIEKVGKNRKDIYHNMRGNDVSERAIKVDQLFLEAEKRGILTIGIGDGGNEIGMGQIAETIRKYVPNGAACNCPCKAGIACETRTDYLVATSVSNWGAYGVAACLAAITGKDGALHSGEREKILLMEASRNGAVDGVTGKSTSSADGLSYEIHAYVVELLRELVKHAI